MKMFSLTYYNKYKYLINFPMSLWYRKNGIKMQTYLPIASPGDVILLASSSKMTVTIIFGNFYVSIFSV